MEIHQIIGLTATSLIIAFGVLKIELIKSYVEKVTGKKGNTFQTLILIVAFSFIPIIIAEFAPIEEAPIEEPKEEIEKSDAELALEVAEMGMETFKKGYEMTKEIIQDSKENKQRRDSIYEATREKRWVYQIGDVMSEDEVILELYNQVKDLSNIYLFKESRNAFVLFKNDGLSEQALNDSLEAFKAKVAHVTPTVKVVDLVTRCKKKEKVWRDKIKLKAKGEKLEVDCFICNKL